MRRRIFLASGAALLAAPHAAGAQQAGRVYRVGVLRQTVPESPNPRSTMISLTTGLRELGYVEGQNLAIEHRFAGGTIERLPELARELVQLKMDVIVAVAPYAIRAARDATTTIPIVMYGGAAPIAAGFVASLARPGGNLTGVLIAPGFTLVGKKLELLQEVVPRAVRIGFLSPDNSGAQGQVPEAQKAAASLNLKLAVAEVQDGLSARGGLRRSHLQRRQACRSTHPRPSASPSRRRCCCGRIRSLNERAILIALVLTGRTGQMR
jgi:putative tryptophan/tyrosine transport system substrate-binding protein